MQRADFLIKDNKEEKMADTSLPETAELNNWSAKTGQDLHAREDQQSGRPEFFTGLVWCQALLIKSWIDAYGRMTRMQKEGDYEEISSLYVDVHEDVFTELFKSQLYASNLGRMINGSMLMMKSWKGLLRSSSLGSTSYQGRNK